MTMVTVFLTKTMPPSPLDPDEKLDTDGYGVGNNADSDDDGDGLRS